MKYLLLLLVACHPTAPPAPPNPPDPPVIAHEVPAPVDAAAAAPPDAAPVEPKNIDSADILARAPTTDEVEVKHVLVAWKDLAPDYRGRLDARAAERTNEEAAALARDLAAQLAKDVTQIDAIMKQHSEDPGSVDGTPYRVAPDSPFVPEFLALALRLHDNEVGIVRSHFGYHVMVRVPPDPLISTGILARAPTEGTVHVQIIVIGWSNTRLHSARTKDEADQQALAVLARIKKGEAMPKLMAELSEDPGTKDTGKPYDIDARSHFEPSLTRLALRLKLGEAGMVKTTAGWIVAKRVSPPPPDPLESAAILKRKPVTEHAKVKHILVGWSDVHAEDERGKTRTRRELEKLVKSELQKLAAGASFEAEMAALSEDPGSVDGKSYDVSDNGTMVAPFVALSLRLNVDEIGVVKTTFGIHIIKRIE